MVNTDAIVVTYNRINKLKECLSNLLSMNLKHIFIVNNASTDGTLDYLMQIEAKNEKVIVKNLRKNIGGAGGFNTGLKMFLENSNSNYVWLMDDDTVPNMNALTKLEVGLSAVPEKNRGFAVGQTYWTDGSLAVMNKPLISSKKADKKSVRYVDEASFVAILIYRNAVLTVGLPIRDFFIWGDDVEYTRRLISNGYLGVQVLDAKIIHKMAANNSTNIVHENNNVGRISRYYYDFRNRVYLSRELGYRRLLKTLVGRIVWFFRIIFYPGKYKLLKLKVLVKGTMDGIKFSPKIEYFKGE
ncbi:glycosyl transferase [Levilactobacillus zymae]|uniref:Glycosyl transferase n=1 Tax=Levilactobacillus zymae TaxID=267363 RepID=A0ABQ0WYH4_9LACO|nr:glycosyltransferase family 2 protein [Levilactobacillus zymae]GEO72156.1 glycosyl transferase [Levilactobacillus zymae]